MKIFISYASEDKDFFNKIRNDLIKSNQEVFTADLILPGESITDKITSNIENSDIIIFILSNKSLKSDWINTEIAYSLAKNRKIIPIKLDKNIEIPFFLKDLFFIDFSNSTNYKESSQKLLESIINSENKKINTIDILNKKDQLIKAQESLLQLERFELENEIKMNSLKIKKSLIISTFIILIIAIVSVLLALLFLNKKEIDLKEYLNLTIGIITGFLISFLANILFNKIKKGVKK